MADLRIGTCSWKFPSWRGLVYSTRGEGSSGAKPSYLQEYVRHYDTVEIDQWFWSLFGQGDRAPDVRLPALADVEAYRASVPDEFKFSVKVPNSITLTHLYRKQRSDPLVANPHFLSPSLFRAFLSRLAPLREVLGPLMFQFGYLNQQMVASQDRFLELSAAFVRQLPGGYLYGLETRNASYLNEAYFEFLNQNSLIPVFLQGYWMPPIVSVYERWRPFVLQHREVVIRLHGPDREGIEARTGKQWNQVVEPRDEELAAVAEMVEDLLSQGVSVYLNVNNHYEGSAPLTIDRIRRLLGEEPIHQGYTQASFLSGPQDDQG
jgi:uncharacterized protein YecE (DUF72 family)